MSPKYSNCSASVERDNVVFWKETKRKINNELQYLSNKVRARGGGWEGRVDMEGGKGWAGMVLATTGLLKGRGLEESHDFCLLCVDLHTISNAPFLADI